MCFNVELARRRLDPTWCHWPVPTRPSRSGCWTVLERSQRARRRAEHSARCTRAVAPHGDRAQLALGLRADRSRVLHSVLSCSFSSRSLAHSLTHTFSSYFSFSTAGVACRALSCTASTRRARRPRRSRVRSWWCGRARRSSHCAIALWVQRVGIQQLRPTCSVWTRSTCWMNRSGAAASHTRRIRLENRKASLHLETLRHA